MATNFSPCKGSYVLNQFPSNVMFGMNGFHVSASGAIQGHHGPLVFFVRRRHLDVMLELEEGPPLLVITAQQWLWDCCLLLVSLVFHTLWRAH